MAIRSQNDDSGSGNNDQACAAAELAAWSSIVFNVLQVTLYLLLRPFRVRLECIVGVAVATLCAVSEALILVNDAEASVAVTLAATAVQLVAMLLTILREALPRRRNVSSIASDKGRCSSSTPPILHTNIKVLERRQSFRRMDSAVFETKLKVLVKLACQTKIHDDDVLSLRRRKESNFDIRT
ncbi:transmembrane protein, putative [Bodo saltans]|uniref:Transmembrane protein, putative n=1 Tax=Bodo saltans TaxID=75058 RepID=A0A0S4JB93_BODSA|nr:transmembrane protein, putative [Bodo saltans]|eukprot:CUG87282.1 transmembrane protein, putative [Bodo saltans]